MPVTEDLSRRSSSSGTSGGYFWSRIDDMLDCKTEGSLLELMYECSGRGCKPD